MCQLVKDLGLPSGYLHFTQNNRIRKARFLSVLMEIREGIWQGQREAKERPRDQKMTSE